MVGCGFGIWIERVLMQGYCRMGLQESQYYPPQSSLTLYIMWWCDCKGGTGFSRKYPPGSLGTWRRFKLHGNAPNGECQSQEKKNLLEGSGTRAVWPPGMVKTPSSSPSEGSSNPNRGITKKQQSRAPPASRVLGFAHHNQLLGRRGRAVPTGMYPNLTSPTSISSNLIHRRGGRVVEGSGLRNRRTDLFTGFPIPWVQIPPQSSLTLYIMWWCDCKGDLLRRVW